MKRFVLGVFMGIVLTLGFLFMGPELLRLVGVDSESLSKKIESIEKRINNLSGESEDAAEQVDKGMKEAGKKVKEIME